MASSGSNASLLAADQDIVFKRCGCTDADTGRQLASRCPHLADSGDGSWYYAVQARELTISRQLVALPGELYCGPPKSRASYMDHPGALEYSIGCVTCTVADMMGAVVVGLLGAAQDRLPADVP